MNDGIRKWILSSVTASVIIVTSAAFHLTQAFSKNFAKGQRELKRDNYPMSLMYFSSAEKANPSDKDTLKHLAITYDMLDRNECVLRQLEKLEQIGRKDFEATTWTADYYYKLGDFERAELLYQRALSNRKDPVVQRKLVEVLYMSLRDFLKALKISSCWQMFAHGTNDMIKQLLFTTS
jgi:tetratricopeptide (TPR) repeat protein